MVSGGLLRRGPEIVNAFIHEPGQVGEALVDIIEMLRQRRILVVNAFVHRGIHVIDSFIHVVEAIAHVIEALAHVIEALVRRSLQVIEAFIDIDTEPGE